MSDQDVARIVADLARVGLRFSVVRRLDGSPRLDRWRTMSYWSHADAAERLWSTLVGNAPDTLDDIAAFIEQQDTPSIVPGIAGVAAQQRHDPVR